MTKEDIIRMAEEAGGYAANFNGRWVFYADNIERFAQMVAAHEREKCARVCELQEDNGGEWDVQQQCANAIMAQDNQTTFDTTGEVCFPSATPIQWTGPDVLTLDYDGRIWPPGTKAPSHQLTVTKSEEKK